MGSLNSVLIADHLAEGEDALTRLSERAAIPVKRLQALEQGAAPRTSEVAVLADLLDVDPIHLFRQAPSVAARRDVAGEPKALSVLLDEIDAYLAAYHPGFIPTVNEAFSARSFTHARTTGEGWAQRAGLRDAAYPDSLRGGTDPLIAAIEEHLHIPVTIWPIRGASAGATVDFSGTIGIWVNSFDQPLSRQRFTLSHELAHVLLKHVDTGRGVALVDPLATIERPETKSERLADACAGGIVYDRDSVVGSWDGKNGASGVAFVAVRHGVSFGAALYALLRHELIDEGEYEALAAERVQPAFADAGFDDVYQLYESGRDRLRLPNLDGIESLRRRLMIRLS